MFSVRYRIIKSKRIYMHVYTYFTVVCTVKKHNRKSKSLDASKGNMPYHFIANTRNIYRIFTLPFKYPPKYLHFISKILHVLSIGIDCLGETCICNENVERTNWSVYGIILIFCCFKKKLTYSKTRNDHWLYQLKVQGANSRAQL